MLFIKKDKYYILEKDIGESIDQFYERGYFIVNMLDKIESNEQKFKDLGIENSIDEAIKFSRLWISIKYNHCSYSKEIMNKIKFFDYLNDLQN